MDIKEFKESLRNGVVEFSYEKKDGTIREAKGTLNSEVYGEENKPKGAGSEVPDNIVKYYDLDKEGWRSFNFDKLIS